MDPFISHNVFMSSAPKLELREKLQTQQLLQSRLVATRWISMTEPEVSREVAELESDPLFQQLLHGSSSGPSLLRRSRWPASSLHPGFYELKENIAAATDSADIHDILEKHKGLMRLIRRIGRDAFEKHFLYAEETKPLPELCAQLKLTEPEGKRILELVLEVGARSEFFRPSSVSKTAGLHYHCIARVEKDLRDPETIYFQFLAPHWARGRYEVLYEQLEDWKQKKGLTSAQKRRLRSLLKKIELLNLRQDTLFQILSRIIAVQSAYLQSRLDFRRRPLSLRELARRIGVAPSTVSRSVGRRSVELPWGEEIPLKRLLTQQRAVVLLILSHWLEQGDIQPGVTDDQLMRRLADEAGINVSRRTVNQCRHKLAWDNFTRH